MAVGLTAPIAAQMLTYSGVAQAQAKPSDYKPTKRGGGGAAQGAVVAGRRRCSIRTSRSAPRTRTARASSTSRSPAGTRTATSMPVLAAEIPSRENGGLAEDGKSVTWKLKQGVKWHDGKPFTADDVRLQLGIRLRSGHRRGDDRQLQGRQGREGRRPHGRGRCSTSRRRSGPTPSSASRGMIIPKHLFADYKGAKSRDAPANLKPVGTGPYKFVDFKPGDMVRGEINPNYHVPNRPYFDTIEMKGGGDAVSAARAVLQTGEYDYAWNLQVEDEILQRLEKGGKGQVAIIARAATSSTSSSTPPTRGPRSTASAPASRPSTRLLTDPAVRQALTLLVDRKSVQEHIYGRTGVATANFVNNPQRFALEEHEVGVQRRQGEPDARRGRLEEGRRRHPRQGRQEAASSSTRPRSTRRARRTRRSSSRPARRPASRSSSSR